MSQTDFKNTKHRESYGGDEDKSRYPRIEIVYYLSDASHIDVRTLSFWNENFAAVQVAAPIKRPDGLPGNILWHCYNRDSNEDPGHDIRKGGNDELIIDDDSIEISRTDIWNRLLKRASAPWVLFLIDDERIHMPALPTVDALQEDYWIPSVIRWDDRESVRQYYQFRLVPNRGIDIFEGKNLPDASIYIVSNNINISDIPFPVYRDSDPYAQIDLEDELSVRNPSPQVYLALGARYFEEGKYVHASAQFRRVINAANVLPYDRLASANGLASCMAEQYKWTQAVEVALNSIKIEACQRLPYLILYRIHQLAKRWNEAHQILKEYYEWRGEWSKANFDKMLPEKDTLAHLADVAFKAGLRQESFNWYKKLHAQGDAKEDPDLLERLLLFAIELSDYDQSVKYFELLFSDKISDKISKDVEKQLFDFLTLFMNRGWYEFASKQYQKLLEHDPANETYMRRWLVTLSKSKDIEKARKIISKIRSRKKAG